MSSSVSFGERSQHNSDWPHPTPCSLPAASERSWFLRPAQRHFGASPSHQSSHNPSASEPHHRPTDLQKPFPTPNTHTPTSPDPQPSQHRRHEARRERHECLVLVRSVPYSTYLPVRTALRAPYRDPERTRTDTVTASNENHTLTPALPRGRARTVPSSPSSPS